MWGQWSGNIWFSQERRLLLNILFVLVLSGVHLHRILSGFFSAFESSKFRRVWGKSRITEFPAACTPSCLLYPASQGMHTRPLTWGGVWASWKMLPQWPCMSCSPSPTLLPSPSWKITVSVPIIKAVSIVPLHWSRHAVKSLGIYVAKGFWSGNGSLWCLRIYVRGFHLT